MAKPSLQFTTLRNHGGMETSQTEYVLGTSSRQDYRECRGSTDQAAAGGVRYEYGPQRAAIHNRELQYMFQLDLEARVFTATRLNRYGSPVWAKPLNRPQLEPSGRTIRIHTDTVDRGERERRFGYEARHIVTTTVRSGPDGDEDTQRQDGWYIDPPEAWCLLHPPNAGRAVLSVSNKLDDYQFTESGKCEAGFPLDVTTVNRSVMKLQDGSPHVHETTTTSRVVELSEAVLEEALFLPAAGFKRVLQLPGEHPYPAAFRLRLRWEELKDSLAGRTRAYTQG